MQKDKAPDSNFDADPTWYKDAVIYQLHVKSFYDGTGDGIGDFKGLSQKLDYLQDLGITAIWLLPFYPSPLRDDGYDIADYRSIHPDYGSMRDFREFLRKAHERGIRVITELVINHTSDQHPWFQAARRSPAGSRSREWYVWSDTPDRYTDTRIIFRDFETSNWTWDPVAKAYYWHRFYSHQPDLNFDNPHVQRAIFNTLDFWMNLGVDGFRIDAVPYLFEREGTNCENLPETHEFVKKLRAHVDLKYKNRMLLAEANQWPEDAAAYFGKNDEFHMAFHFPLMPRLYMALQMEDSFPILDILEQTPAIYESCQWAIFLRNHDELTLEMVTDEERDYMYRVYAHDPKMRINQGIRRRLAPLLGNHRRRIELMNALLFSMPGTPIVYYGDEIGMGDNIHLGDRDGVRTPMQWTFDRNAGFSWTNPQALFLPVNISPEYHFEVANVEVQQQNPHSILWWMKRIIMLRKRFKAFSRGSIEFIRPDNHHILAFIRRYTDQNLLVVVNLSRFVQFVELDLSAYQGMIPVELFGRTRFPAIGSRPYFLSMGPHDFYWFYLSGTASETEETKTVSGAELPELSVSSCNNLFTGKNKARIEEIFSAVIRRTRWFGGKARIIKQLLITDVFPLAKSDVPRSILFVQVSYTSGDFETYVLPVTCTEASAADEIFRDNPWAAIAWLKLKNKESMVLLHDGLADRGFCNMLLKMFDRRQRIQVGNGEIGAVTTSAFASLKRELPDPAPTLVIDSEQSNTSVIFGSHLILKIIRRLTPGLNPDFEIGSYLTEKKFPHTPQLAGAIEFYPAKGEPMTLATLHELVIHQSDAWRYALDQLTVFFENALAGKEQYAAFAAGSAPSIEQIPEILPAESFEVIGSFIESARLLGNRTAQMHGVLAAAEKGSRFEPEPFTKLYQRSLYQSLRAGANKTLALLRRNIDSLPAEIHSDAKAVLEREKDIQNAYKPILDRKISILRIRCHGDYHLGQVLYTGKDFQIIDFEGEPVKPISERKIKRTALRDVAGMLRSFHYAAYSALFSLKRKGIIQDADEPFLKSCAVQWYEWVRTIFLQAYLAEAKAEAGNFLPENIGDFKLLLEIFLLDKAIYEVSYELNNRPEWVTIPLRGILELLSNP